MTGVPLLCLTNIDEDRAVRHARDGLLRVYRGEVIVDVGHAQRTAPVVVRAAIAVFFLSESRTMVSPWRNVAYSGAAMKIVE